MSTEDRGWVAEFLPRHSKELVVIQKDGEVRGQIEIQTEEEKKRWQRAMKQLNEPLERENTSGTLITK
jgi:hypothetical protein